MAYKMMKQENQILCYRLFKQQSPTHHDFVVVLFAPTLFTRARFFLDIVDPSSPYADFDGVGRTRRSCRYRVEWIRRRISYTHRPDPHAIDEQPRLPRFGRFGFSALNSEMDPDLMRDQRIWRRADDFFRLVWL
jgi:hypothetical protein